MSFFEELNRRNVVKVAVLYIVASWLILQVADVLSSLLPVPEWTGSLVFIFLALGFPLVMIFSWVYELTPEGLKRERDVDRSQSVTHETGRKINMLIVALLVLAIGAVVVDRLIPEQVAPAEPVAEQEVAEPSAVPSELAAAKFAPPPERSIAVLPFVNMSSDPEQEYFSDGLSEELLNLLAKVPELTVASRTSAFYFKGKDVKLSDVADDLNVAHILEGSVRKSGNKVRITAQLIDSERDAHLWSETWDRTLDDVFIIQDEIAASVVESLKITLLGQAPVAIETDPEAYNLFLQGKHLQQQGSRVSMLKSIEIFEQALAIDPDYVPALNGMSAAYTNLAGSNATPSDVGYARAREISERVLEIDPDNPNAYVGLGWLARVYDGNFEEAARYLERALALAPNDDRALNAAAVLLGDLGRHDEARRINQVLVDRDPVSPTAYHNLGVGYYALGDMEAATMSFDKALTLSPDMILARWWRAYMYCVEEEYPTCLQAYADTAELASNDGIRIIGEAMALYPMGREQEAASALATLEQDYMDDFYYVTAAIHANQGRADAAIALFRKVFEREGVRGLTFFNKDPRVQFLEEDPRMQALLKEAGLTEAQLSRIEFQVDLPD
ncbi:MAG: tetratricopeptide repeat protein [Gammaproteobacteria bacterium]|nr:MAG: tetratricopeptide repeat protein [Gammaproteobacteria bacterium]